MSIPSIPEPRVYGLIVAIGNNQKYHPEQNSTVVGVARKVFLDSGLSKGPDAAPVTVAVFRQSQAFMEMKTIELCPSLAGEVRNFSARAR